MGRRRVQVRSGEQSHEALGGGRRGPIGALPFARLGGFVKVSAQETFTNNRISRLTSVCFLPSI